MSKSETLENVVRSGDSPLPPIFASMCEKYGLSVSGVSDTLEDIQARHLSRQRLKAMASCLLDCLVSSKESPIDVQKEITVDDVIEASKVYDDENEDDEDLLPPWATHEEEEKRVEKRGR